MERVDIWRGNPHTAKLRGVGLGLVMALGVAAAVPLAVGWVPPWVAGLLLSGVTVAGLIATVRYLNRPGHVDFGADGLLVSRGDGERYVPFASVREVVLKKQRITGDDWWGVELRLGVGEPLVLWIGQYSHERRVRADEFVLRLDTALAAFERSVENGIQRLPALERGERSPRDWLGSLRGIGEGERAQHREASITQERLWEVFEDPSAPSCARAGAMAALVPHLDAAGTARVRVALEHTAAPKLRVAVEGALAGDDEALVVALEELDRARSAG